jgi:hypothetical protein
MLKTDTGVSYTKEYDYPNKSLPVRLTYTHFPGQIATLKIRQVTSDISPKEITLTRPQMKALKEFFDELPKEIFQ